MRILHVLERKVSPVDMLQRLQVQRFRLVKHSESLKQQMGGTRTEVKEHLKSGDETGFRLDSRKYVMLKNTYLAVKDLQELAQGMVDVIQIGDILHDVVAAGMDIAKLQSKLGLDTAQLESSLAKIKTSLTHMEGVANALSMTMESSLPSSKELSTEQEILRKELLVEIQGEKIEEVKLKEKIATELDKVEKVQG